jgi:hypothetical protein
MEARRIDSGSPAPSREANARGEQSLVAQHRVDWEAFYRSYRKPGYVPGFEIVNKLGGGMFGLVFKARKASIGKDYAIKFLKVDDDSVRDAVLREIENVSFFAQIDHPNLVSIEDRGAVDGIPFLVMSYAGEATLQKRLEERRLTRDEALHVFVHAARGLHDHSLVHFDLKPANIFLKGDVARVGDYGLSKLVSASRNSLSFGRGTPYYMAPEMLQRRGDARSDVYSLGIVLYECLYGDVPFRGDSEWEVLRKHETAPVVFPDDSLPQDRDVVRRCLAKKPEDRFQSAGELLRALQAPVQLGESIVFGAVAEGPNPAASPAPRREAGRAAAASPPPLPPGAEGSPYGMPWKQDVERTGVFATAVRILFTAMQLLVSLILLPVKAISLVVGKGLLWVLRLPFRILGLMAQLVGLLLVVAIIVLIVVTVLSLVSAV